MSNQENTKSFGQKVVSFFKAILGAFKKFGNLLVSLWNGAWGGMEKASLRFQEVYELRDFKSTSSAGIGFVVLAIAFGMFHLNIGSVSNDISISGTFVDSVGDVFLLVSLLLLIAGTLTASSAGLIFLFVGMTLPAVGEIINVIINICTGNAAYIASNWIYLVFFVAFAAVYVLTLTKVLTVKLGRWILAGVSVAAAAYALIAFILKFPPFFGTELVNGNSEDVLYVTKMFEFVCTIVAMLMIHLTVFDYSTEHHVVSKAVETDDKEEF